MGSSIALIVDGKERYYGEDSTSDRAVWVLERERTRTFGREGGQAMLKWLKTAYRLPGEPQLRERD